MSVLGMFGTVLKAGKLKRFDNPGDDPFKVMVNFLDSEIKREEANAKGANVPDPQKDPETKASRQAAQEKIKRKGGGTVLSPQRLGLTGVDLGRHQLGVADAGANKLGVGVR